MHNANGPYQNRHVAHCKEMKMKVNFRKQKFNFGLENHILCWQNKR